MKHRFLICVIALTIISVGFATANAQGYQVKMKMDGVKCAVKPASIDYQLGSIPSVGDLVSGRLDVLPDGRLFSGEECRGMTFSFIKQTDKCTPLLLDLAETKTEIATVDVVLLSSSGKRIARYTMSNAVLSRSSSSGGEEAFSLNFEKIKWKLIAR